MTAPTFRWPGLGFDPAPGDPVTVGTLVTSLSGTARRLRETHDALAALTGAQGGWEGEAAAAFASTLQELPAYLAGAQESLRRTGGLLDGWRGSLDGFGGRARELETRAAAVRGDLVRAEGGYEQARRHPDLALAGGTYPTDQLPAVNARIETARAELERATAAVTRLDAELRELLGAAESLSDEHRTEARRVADGIRRADDGLAPPEPSWFEQAGGWVMENLGTIGDVAGMVSGVASALALIPILTPFAGPIALVAGGVAATAHGLELILDEDKRTDPNALIGFIADLVGLVPGGRFVVGGAIEMGRGFSAAGPGYAALGGIVGAADGFGRAVTDLGGAGPIGTIVGERLAPHLDRLLGRPADTVDPDIVAKAVEGTVNVGVQAPTVVDLTTEADVDAAKNVAAGVGSAHTAGNFGLDLLARRTADAAAAAAT